MMNMTERKEIVGAVIQGGPMNPDVRGYIIFHDVPNGTEVEVTFEGLPEYQPPTQQELQIGPFGFHIHERGVCEVTDPQRPFITSGSHYNPTNQPHGNHVGDFPVLFSNHGYAWMAFFTDKMKPADVVGRSVILHASPDDYTTQPAGFSGRRIACGVIERMQL